MNVKYRAKPYHHLAAAIVREFGGGESMTMEQFFEKSKKLGAKNMSLFTSALCSLAETCFIVVNKAAEPEEYKIRSANPNYPPTAYTFVRWDEDQPRTPYDKRYTHTKKEGLSKTKVGPTQN